MLKIGLTGGIGAGKSLVSQYFQLLGAPIYLSDTRAKALMLEEPVRSNIISTFGKESYLDGVLNRAYLSNIVFNNKKQLEKLNNIVHPAVADDYYSWHDAQRYYYTIQESAIIFESNFPERFDKIITVTAPDDIRIHRVIKRDSATKESIEARMSNQITQKEKIERSHYHIINDGKLPLIPQILKIHLAILAA